MRLVVALVGCLHFTIRTRAAKDHDFGFQTFLATMEGTDTEIEDVVDESPAESGRHIE